ncbi:DctP family TRAP transporter solute-binding subunit [Microbacterium thalassium]|uniref:Tripartite ATP-independent transporter DctP family solute receptor n=1 Tax=Microbacterium thalassium TaxID=362649 RepID=A0A7X0KU08_9MICO|nr:DctP family TRAP transporter solute-binding subunit [Microbacterium thalassium]MBB6390603.1 tripartite ATP-independent transporter DctP family solute receptor [Microbacterium thalassium]GLK25713.1 ABC transporter substrate-binding protein [Microbacterium thalassium]
MTARRNKRTMWIALAAAPALMLVGCTSGGGDADSGTGDETEVRTLQLAHSYTEEQPQHACGAQVIADEVAAADVGLEIEIFPASQLGGDADRIALVASGDIDMDIQGASALGAVYEPISVLDAAYAFDDADHLAAFMASDESSVLVDGFKEASGVQVVGVWSAGERHFTSNTPIRTPEDLDGVRMRFPGSPQYLMNAEALGADATEVAYEELYLALQQGTVDAQENPITNILAQSFYEVQDYLNLSAHQLNTNLVIVSPVWDELTEEQQEALTAATETAVTSVTECIEEEAEATLDEWRSGDDWEVIEDVDREAFQEMTVAYFEENYTGDSLEVFEAIRATAP